MAPVESAPPDFRASLRLDSRAPRAARYYVAQVDHPAPDLRDAVVLLTSELVTRAVAQCASGPEQVELRVWMPHDIVRVELRARRELLRLPLDDRNGPEYDVMLLGQVADRWSIDTDQEPACMWFEIDRHAPTADASVEPNVHAWSARRRRRLVRRRSADRAR
jgi:hypothetical protein